jgi:hypothetical protein
MLASKLKRRVSISRVGASENRRCSYYMSFTDDYTRQTVVHFLKTKSQALGSDKQYETWLLRQRDGTRVKTLRSDRGGKYLSEEFDKYLQEQGIELQLTVHDSPQQNSVAERLNRTLVDHARAMLLARDLPKNLWAEAVDYATWLKNRLPSRAIPDHKPYKLLHGRRPSLALAHEFGCPVYFHVTEGGKLEARAEEAVFVGVDGQSKGYRVYWPEKRRISVERNVSFVPQSVVVQADVPNEGESQSQAPIPTDNVQNVAPTPPQTPSTTPRTPLPLQTPPAPNPTRMRRPPGCYAALNEGQVATLAAAPEDILERAESDLNDEEALTRWQEHAMAAAAAEPTLSQALSSPDTVEWQEIGQLEIREARHVGSSRLTTWC